jgi:hypothetical protein
MNVNKVIRLIEEMKEEKDIDKFLDLGNKLEEELKGIIIGEIDRDALNNSFC